MEEGLATPSKVGGVNAAPPSFRRAGLRSHCLSRSNSTGSVDTKESTRYRSLGAICYIGVDRLSRVKVWKMETRCSVKVHNGHGGGGGDIEWFLKVQNLTCAVQERKTVSPDPQEKLCAP